MSLGVYLYAVRRTEVFEANITHNLGKMASSAGLYYPMWRPEQAGIKTAGQLIPLLEAGITVLRSEPEFFRKFDPDNGWGSYDGLLSFAENYLKACRDNPDAEIGVSR